jgi:hypothetical protein
VQIDRRILATMEFLTERGYRLTVTSHIHVGFTPLGGAGEPFDQLARIFKPEQWERLIDRLGEIENPEVQAKPSEASLPADNHGSAAHKGD